MSEPLYKIEFDEEDLIEVDGYYYVTEPEKVDEDTCRVEIAWHDVSTEEDGEE